MSEKIKALKQRPKIVIAAILIIAAVFAVVFSYAKMSGDKETVVTEDAEVTAIDLRQSVTAAGEIVTAEEETIAFSTSKYFRAMCVEEDEFVTEGQHLILYSDGTYEDAPGDGFVTAINAPATGSVAGSSNTLTFAYSDKLMVDITVPEGEINSVSVGNHAEIAVGSDASRVYEGVISKKKAISTTLLGSGSSGSSGSGSGGSDQSKSPFGSESSTAYYTVSLTFDNDGTVVPGMSAICTITISEKKGVTAVPIEAVQFDDNGEPYVLLVTDSGVSETPVTTGGSDAEYVEITEGLKEGDTVRIERKG